MCVCLHPSSIHCTFYFLNLVTHNQKQILFDRAEWPTLCPVAEASIIHSALDNILFTNCRSINKMTIFEFPDTLSYVHHNLFFISIRLSSLISSFSLSFIVISSNILTMICLFIEYPSRLKLSTCITDTVEYALCTCCTCRVQYTHSPNRCSLIIIITVHSPPPHTTPHFIAESLGGKIHHITCSV